MKTKIHVLVIATLCLSLAACSKESSAEAKDGMTKAAEGVAQGWDAMLHDLEGNAGAFKSKVAAAKPEMKAQMEALEKTFNEQVALAKQKFAEAKAAAPAQMEALKQEANTALDKAKKAWTAATSH